MSRSADRIKRTRASRQHGDGKYVVVCERQDGGRRAFQAYANEAEAQAVAERLRAVGCRVTVEAQA